MLAPAWVSSGYSFMPRASMIRSWSPCKTACLKIPLAIFISSPGKIRCGLRPARLPGGEDAGDEHKQKQQEIKGFPGWLEGYLGAKVDDLTPRPQLAELLRARLREASWRCSRKNRKKLASIPPVGSRQRRCGPSSRGRLGKLLPLMERTPADG